MLTRVFSLPVRCIKRLARSTGKRRKKLDVDAVLREHGALVEFIASAFAFAPRSRVAAFVFNAVEGTLAEKLVCVAFALYILTQVAENLVECSARVLKATESPPSRVLLDDRIEGVNHDRERITDAFGVSNDEFLLLLKEAISKEDRLYVGAFFEVLLETSKPVSYLVGMSCLLGTLLAAQRPADFEVTGFYTTQVGEA